MAMMLGLPVGVKACLFDLDGVLTQTATRARDGLGGDVRRVPAAAGRPPGSHAPFDPGTDYDRYVDGRPRADGVRTFLALARASSCPRAVRTTRRAPNGPRAGQPEERRAAEPHPRRRRPGVRRARCDTCGRRERRDCAARGVIERQHREVLRAAGLADLFEATGRRDRGARTRSCPANPRRTPSSRPPRASASSARPPWSSRTRWPGWRPAGPGVSLCVVGVDRVGQADALREHGADVVVKDLAELLGPGSAVR